MSAAVVDEGAVDLDVLARLVFEAAAEDRSGWSGAARAERVLGFVRVRCAAEAGAIDALVDADRDRAWAADGDTSAVAWLGRAGELGATAAARLVGAARLAARHPEVAEALADRRVGAEALGVLARVARDRDDLFARDADVLLVEAARLRVDDLRRVTRRWAVLADDTVDRQDRGADGGPRRWLHASPTFGGHVAVEGLLDPEGGALLLGILDPGPPAPDDRRTAGERRADALVEHLRGDGTGGRRAVPELTVLVGTAGHGDAHRPGDTREGHLEGDGGLPAWAGELGRIGPVPRTLLDRLACDATVRRVVVEPPGEVLDLGRATRVVTPAQRRALEVRDRGCAWPGCDRPPAWCDAHHRVPWTHGGPTTTTNLVLLCRRHHVAVHEGRARLPDPARPPPDTG